MVAFADRLGAADLATGHYARVTRRRAAARRRRPGQGPDLHALRASRPATLARMRFPLGRADQAARCGRWPPRPGCPWPPRPSRRTCASWPAPARRAFLARHAGLDDAPGRDRRPRRPRARRAPRRAPLHRRPAQGPRRRRAGAALRARHRHGVRTASSPARARRSRRPRSRCAARGCTGAAEEVDAVKLRYRSRAVPCRVGRRARSRPGRAGARGARRRRRARADRLPAARRRRRRVGDDRRGLDCTVPWR